MTTGEFSVTGKRVVVVGAARSGIAAAELLTRRGARVVLTDVRCDLAATARLQATDIALELGEHRPETFTAADLIVLSPGVPPEQPAVMAARHAGVEVIGELELASRWLRGRLVAITGTKGKSTTATLAGQMLQAAGLRAMTGGNIGTPLSAQVPESTPETLHVVEASSFQLETSDTFHPWIAVLLNFSADHLDRHPSVAAYADAKARIFANQNEHDWAVINADDPEVLALARRGRARQLRFAVTTPLREGIVVSAGAVAEQSATGRRPLVPLSAVRVLGHHLLSDVVAAAAISSLVGVHAEAMTRVVEQFTGLEHAMEIVATIGGVRFVNDSKATNVESAVRAVETFERDLVVILGGRFKGGDLTRLRPALTARAHAVVAIGEARPLIHEALAGAVPVRDAQSLADAVRSAFEAAPPCGVVLLAPACASFDMFADYAERGRMFKREVAQLAKEVARAREQ